LDNQDSQKDNLAPHIALFAVQVMFGSSAILGKYALMAFPPVTIVGFRVAGAAIAFSILQNFRGGLRLEQRAHYLYFALFACFGVIFNQLLFFKGLSLTTATNTSLLAVMIPVFATLVSVLIGNDRLNALKIAGIVLAGGGGVYLIDPQNASFSSATTRGDVLVILNSMSYATYIAVSKRLITHYGALKSIAWLFLFASVVNVPVGLISLSSVNVSQSLRALGWRSAESCFFRRFSLITGTPGRWRGSSLRSSPFTFICSRSSELVWRFSFSAKRGNRGYF
jgi:drug/metabolite transporter (DMT)-like permease